MKIETNSTSLALENNVVIFILKPGQQYNLKGSSFYAEIGENFTWTCDIFIPPDQTLGVVTFYRNNSIYATVGHINGMCLFENANPRYTSGCSSSLRYTLTIPAENMTESEQGSVWRCEYFADDTFKSSDATLTIASM